LKNVLWNPAESWAFQNAFDKSLPIVLFFVEKDDEDARKLVSGQSVAAYSTDKAMFIIVPKLVEEKAAEAKDGPTVTGGGRAAQPTAKVEVVVGNSPVPFNKLEQADLWKAYGVSKGNTMIVADWFGNSQTTYSSVPKEGVLTRSIDTVPETVKQTETKVNSELKKLDAQLEKGSDSSALKSALKIFKMDVWGFAGVTNSIEKYSQIVSRGRERMNKIEASADVVALRKLKSEYRGSELDNEIDAAVSRITAEMKK
jgi:hypothetical protein